MSQPAFTMQVQLHRSPLDARRGIVRLNRDVLELLRVRPWDPLAVTGTRSTGALAAAAPSHVPREAILLDDLTIANAGADGGGTVVVSSAVAHPARRVCLQAEGSVRPDPASLRFALLGKVVVAGDRVSLLPQDFDRPPGAGPVEGVIGALGAVYGDAWQTVVLEVASTDPGGLVRITMETEVVWEDGLSTTGSTTPLAAAPAREDLPGLEALFDRLEESFDLGFHHKDLLTSLGTSAQMGVLVTGPPGSGKGALVDAVAAHLAVPVSRLWGPALARAEPAGAAEKLTRALRTPGPAFIVVEDVDAIAPAENPGPLFSVLLEGIRAAVARGEIGVICTTAHPERTCPDLRYPGTLDVELEIALPQAPDRRRILEVHSKALPLSPDVDLEDVAATTPGFVAADLMALCREAALRAAQRAADGKEAEPRVHAADFSAALEVVKPSALDGVSVEVEQIDFDDVGDMEEVKRALTESALWPLRYPDTFERMGVDPPTGMLLFGPPGCGKTFLVKALANEAAANFLSIKGAELLSKWVGESERGVRELFRRARSAAPAIIFFDEIDALAPPRGGAQDTGTTDRVVAQLLTELDGVEDVRSVFVVGATNRPDLVDAALLRPGRMERLVYVPPPDAPARVSILKTVTRRMPLGVDVDIDELGAACEGYSAADLEALARTAAMSAMREGLDTPAVTSAHFEAARAEVHPSLRRDQIAALERFAADRTGRR
ncbi:MAG TPA: AAA family ATPase [Actinomycetota bacterium]|nr:AAA family ATPase [Actinomycetota bacterium]